MYNYLKNTSNTKTPFIVLRSRAVGHQSHDLILRCLFSLEECGSENFTYFQDPTYYNCYTFNGRKNRELVARTTGPQQGKE